MDRQAGFTLIELMITIAIVGILAAIAYPSYQENVKKGRRSDAQSALSAFANAMSQWYLQEDATLGKKNSSYLKAGPGGANTGVPTIFSNTVPLSGGQATYNLTIHSATRNSFTLRATPTGLQGGDGFLELTSMGQRRWDKNSDGEISGDEETGW